MVNKKYWSSAILLVLSIISIWGITFAIRTSFNDYALTNSIIGVIAATALFFFYKKVFITDGADRGRRTWIITIAYALLFSAMLIIGTSVYRTDSARLTMPLTYLKIAALSPVFCAVLFWISDLIKAKYRPREIQNDVAPINTKKTFLICLALIFACWLPAFLSTLPGIWGYDCIYQMRVFLEGSVSTHHPIAHTYIMCGIVSLGKMLFGKYEYGMAMYSVLQMLILSATFSMICCYVRKNLKKPVFIICLLFYALVPYNALFSFSGTKDVLFSAFFAWWILTIVIMIKQKEEFWCIKNCILFVVSTLLLCLFRNNGIYVFCAFAIVMIIYFRKCAKYVIPTCLCVVVLWGVYTGPVYNMIGVRGSGYQETLSMPIQQLGRAYVLDDGELTEEDKALIKEYIPNVEKYNARTSDNIKNTFNNELFRENKVDFIKLWINVGLKKPALYVDALLNTSIGFWYPDMVYRDERAWHPYIEYVNSDLEGDWVLLERTSLFPAVSEAYDYFSYSTPFQGIPVLSIIFQPSLPFWISLVLSYLALMFKKKKVLLPLLAIGLYWGTCILGPVVLLRYAYPMIISIPLIMCSFFEKNEWIHSIKER